MHIGTNEMHDLPVNKTRMIRILTIVMTLAISLSCVSGNKDRNRVSDSQALGEFSAGENQDSLRPNVYSFPEEGTFGQEQLIELYADKGPVKIYYALNGKPKVDSEFEYQPGTFIEIAETATLYFFAVDQAGNNSAMAVKSYEIVEEQSVIPFQPPEGGYTNPIVLQFFPDSGIKVYYTTDQSDPRSSNSAELYRTLDEACSTVTDPDCPANGYYDRSNIQITRPTQIKYVAQKPDGQFLPVETIEYYVSDGGQVGTGGSVNLTYLVLQNKSVPVELDQVGLGALPEKVRKSLKIMEMDLIQEGLLENTFDAIKCGPNATKEGAEFTNCGEFPDGTPERNLQKLLTMNAVTADLSGSSIAPVMDATNLLGLQGGAVGFLQHLMKTSSENEAFLPTSVVQDAVVDNLIKIHPEATRAGTLPIYLEDGLTEMESLSERLSRSDQNADGIDDGTGKKIIFTFKDYADNTRDYPVESDSSTWGLDPDNGNAPVADYDRAFELYNTPDGLDDRTHCPEDVRSGDGIAKLDNGDVLTDDPPAFDFAGRCDKYPGGATAGHPGQTEPYEYLPYFGFIDPTKTTQASVMQDDFEMKINASLSGVAQKGFDFKTKVIANAFDFDPSGVTFPQTSDEDFVIEGLVPGQLSMDMGFRMVEFPAAFPEFGARRFDFDDDLSGDINGRGTSGIWNIDTYYLEYVVMDASYRFLRGLYMDETGGSGDDPVHDVYCGGGTSGPGCFTVAEVWVGYDNSWNSSAVPSFLNLPGSASQAQMLELVAPGPYLYMESVLDPPQMSFYLHDLLSFVANKRMHDTASGTIPEGEANVSLQLNGITLNIDDTEIRERVKQQMLANAGLKSLQDTTAALFSSDSSNVADVYIEKNDESNAEFLARVTAGGCDNLYTDITDFEENYPYALVFKTENLNYWQCSHGGGTSCPTEDKNGKLYNSSRLRFYRDFNLTTPAACQSVIFIPKDSNDNFYKEPNNVYFVEVADGQQFRLKINHTTVDAKLNFDWVRVR
jgi:hypothetical protein